MHKNKIEGFDPYGDYLDKHLAENVSLENTQLNIQNFLESQNSFTDPRNSRRNMPRERTKRNNLRK